MQTHLKARGFDAVLHLCKVLSKYNTDYHVDKTSIVRMNTKAQVGLSRSERLTNMKNAFKIIDERGLRNHRICVVDDVITTGSTLRELRKICLEAGAKEVFAITIAH
jgi:competence protein ComFC